MAKKSRNGKNKDPRESKRETWLAMAAKLGAIASNTRIESPDWLRFGGSHRSQ